MSPKELPAPGRAGDLTAILRSRHSAPTAPAAPAPAIDPFLPQPVDPAAVTGSAEERLAVFESAIDRAKETVGQTLKASRARFVVEAGMALRAIRDEELYKLTHETFEDYVTSRWDMDRTRAYQFIEAAPTVLVLWKIFDTAPVESHARVLTQVLEGHGEPAVREVIAAARTKGEKITAATIRDAADRLGYIPQPTQSAESENTLPVDHTSSEARALVRLEQGLAALRGAHRALRGRVIPDAVAADHAHGSLLVAEIADLAAKISRLAQ